jgi:hypothetical protein
MPPIIGVMPNNTKPTISIPTEFSDVFSISPTKTPNEMTHPNIIKNMPRIKISAFKYSFSYGVWVDIYLFDNFYSDPEYPVSWG